MIINTNVGTFELIKNYRDAFDKTLFEAKYVDVAFDRYQYIVGDVIKDDKEGDRLRLKGFSKNLQAIFSFKKIPDYIAEYCNANVPYYILKRINSKKDEEIEDEQTN